MNEVTARLWKAFQEVDDDGNGTLSKRELYRALGLAGIAGSPAQMLSLYRMADVDGDGKDRRLLSPLLLLAWI